MSSCACVQATLDLGTDRFGFGFGGTGKKSHNKQFDDYGEAFGMHDVIGCFLNLDERQISFSKNGVDLGRAFMIHQNLKDAVFYPAVVLKVGNVFLFHPKFRRQLTASFSSRMLKCHSTSARNLSNISRRVASSPLTRLLRIVLRILRQHLAVQAPAAVLNNRK